MRSPARCSGPAASLRLARGENHGLSGQCGFSSTVEGNALTYDEQVAKLRLIAETADDIWG
jgi:hypothetical protein